MFINFRINLIKLAINVIERFTFEKKLRKYYSEVLGKDIKVIIDIGANKGQSIDLFLRINPNCTIYAFEPNPSLFTYLEKKYAGLKNIRLFQMGVSSETGELIFNENVLNHTSTFENINMNSGYLKSKAKILGVPVDKIIKARYIVKTITLSEFIQANIKSDIDIVKIDTEGHEHACLLGLFNKKPDVQIKYLQLESHNDDMYEVSVSSEKIPVLLEQNNFELVKKIPHFIGEYEELIYKYKN